MTLQNLLGVAMAGLLGLHEMHTQSEDENYADCA
jgi:hypothetical protein